MDTSTLISSHCDIAGNEMADSLAKKALKKQTIDINITPDVMEKRCHSNTLYNQIWQVRWHLAEHGRHLYSIIPQVNKKRDYCDFSLL